MRFPAIVSLFPIILLLSACGAETENSTAPQQVVLRENAEPLSIPEYAIEEFMGSTAYSGASFSSGWSPLSGAAPSLG